MLLGKPLPTPVLVTALCLIAVAVSLRTSPVHADAEWNWPIVGDIVRPFDKPATAWGAGHRGINVQAAPGAIIRSPLSGTVTFSGRVAGRSLVVITSLDEVFDVDLEPLEPAVREGDIVRGGDELGRLAAGHDGGNSLHIGIRRDGAYVNPMGVLGPPPRVIVRDSWIISYALG